MTRIVVLGSANLDLVVRQPRPARPGETIFGDGFATAPGGKGLNQAIAAARAGADVAFLGAVGDDDFGRTLRAQLDADGVDTSGLVTADDPTGTAHIAVVPGGENSIVVVPGANAAVGRLTAYDRERIAGADVLLVQLERPLPLVAEALAFARAGGVRTVLTPAPVAPLGADVLGLVDVLVPNALEARELAGLDDELAAAARLGERGGVVVMTRGADGAVLARGGAVVAEVAAHPVDAVDTTAAGDTFVGVLAARLGRSDDPGDWEEALAAATVAGAISVTRPGAAPSMPRWTEIAARL